MTTKECTPEVNFDVFPPGLGVHLPQWADGPVHASVVTAGVVDQDVYLAEAVDGGVHEAFH